MVGVTVGDGVGVQDGYAVGIAVGCVGAVGAAVDGEEVVGEEVDGSTVHDASQHVAVQSRAIGLPE